MAIALACEALYEAAIEPDSWSQALNGFARATGSVGCRFRMERAGPNDVRLPASPDIGGFAEDFLAEGWHRADPRAIRGIPLVDAGRRVVIEHDISNEEERRRSPFYQTLLRRHDIPWWAVIAIPLQGSRMFMSMHRSAAQGPYTPADASDLAAVIAQLRRVVSLADRFALARALGAAEALEGAGCAALVLSARGQCLVLNALAEKSLGGDIALVRGRLHANDRESDQRLQTLIDRAVGPRAPGDRAPAPVFVRRRDRRPYMIEAMPATGALRDIFDSVAALLLITDLDARPLPAEGLIRDAFGLTPAEARLAAALASGDDLRTAAERLKTTHETSRGHLKAIFSKTGVNRQSELAALIARLRAPGRA